MAKSLRRTCTPLRAHDGVLLTRGTQRAKRNNMLENKSEDVMARSQQLARQAGNPKSWRQLYYITFATRNAGYMAHLPSFLSSWLPSSRTEYQLKLDQSTLESKTREEPDQCLTGVVRALLQAPLGRDTNGDGDDAQTNKQVRVNVFAEQELVKDLHLELFGLESLYARRGQNYQLQETKIFRRRFCILTAALRRGTYSYTNQSLALS